MKKIELELDDVNGILWKRNERVILLPAFMIVNIYNGIKEIVGESAARAFLASIGREIGKTYVNIMRNILEKENVQLENDIFLIELLEAEMMEDGWGAIKTNIDLEKKLIVVDVKNCLAEYANNCLFEIMVIKGIAEEVIGKEVSVEETKCVLKGDEYCRVEVRW
jgi:predicted hydrocarbon binding protein